jgi:murein DD-endopeptidase MepM/ murein hydrolase activator NlpD
VRTGISLVTVRWATWPAISIALLLASGAMVPGESAVRPRVAPRVRSANAARRMAPHSAAHTLAMLRARWPVRGPINSGFGPRGSFWRRHFHAGVDIGARRGTPVHAPAAGTVVFAGWRSGFGRTVVIDHGGRVESLYAHLSRLEVRSRQRIGAGTEIARTGATGNASGPHLHYEILVDGRPVNPQSRSVRIVRPVRPAATATAKVDRNAGSVRHAGRSNREPRRVVHAATHASTNG